LVQARTSQELNCKNITWWSNRTKFDHGLHYFLCLKIICKKRSVKQISLSFWSTCWAIVGKQGTSRLANVIAHKNSHGCLPLWVLCGQNASAIVTSLSLFYAFLIFQILTWVKENYFLFSSFFFLLFFIFQCGIIKCIF
jgi:hypothetical protein